MKTLYLIPARGGSKGLPGKNIKLLGGKPLISYTIEAARAVAVDADICVSTDDAEVKSIAEVAGLNVPFVRPGELASDEAGMRDVVIHALRHYEMSGIRYDAVMLLQPTSPFRETSHLSEVQGIYHRSSGIEMVVSVGIAPHNPYFTLAEETPEGYLRPSKEAKFERRQDCPAVYFYNGSIYLIDAESLRERSMRDFTRVKKYVMEHKYCLDIDTIEDWKYAEFLIERGEV